MPEKTEALGELYEDITGETSVTESQEEEPSRDPIDDDLERQLEEYSEDGLGEAVAGAETTEQAA